MSMNLLDSGKIKIFCFIIIFLFYISFIPESVQKKYPLYKKLYLWGLFLFLLIYKKREIKFFFDKDSIFLGLFLFSLLAGVFSAQNKKIAIQTYTDILIIFPIFYLIKEIFAYNKDYGLRLIRIFCVFGLIVAVIGFLEFLFRKNILYEYLFESPYYLIYMQDIIPRPLSTQSHPAVLATFLLVCFCFNLFLFKNRANFFRLIFLISSIITLTVLTLTFSRGAFLGLVGAILFYLWHKNKSLAGLFFIIFLLIVTLCSLPTPLQTLKRFGIQGIFYGREFTSIFSPYRWERLKMSFRMFKDHPFLGIGLEHFRIKFDQYYISKNEPVPYNIKIADNMYLTLLAETGLIGFMGFVLFIFFLFKNGITYLKKLAGLYKELLLVSLSAWIGILINMTGYELLYWRSPYALFCILCGIIASNF